MRKASPKLLTITLAALLYTALLAAQTKGKSLKPQKIQAAAKTETKVAADPWKLLNSKERLVEITTDYGTMIAKLYDSTPLHRDNFIRLVQQKFYDSLLFHRVIPQFMIQGGDPESKNAPDDIHLGSGSLPGDRIPAEFKPYLFHKKGALAAARDDNPVKASSNCQYYIVSGKPVNEQELDGVFTQRVKPANPSFNYTPAQKEVYHRLGGTPFLDQSYTVFGEVISGLDVVDKIANRPGDESNRPLQNIRMKIRMLN
jgi:cyclophilin family peptidyl-prolyl cis-trans isomerase